MRPLIFLQLLCVFSLGEVLGAARVTKESNDTICGLLKRGTPKNDTPEGFQLALNVTCSPHGGRHNYCWEWKNDSGYTCLKRWKTCLKSAFARVSYDLKKVVSDDQKDYSVIFVRAFKNTTSSTDSYDEVIDNKFLTCLDGHTVKVLTECTGDLTTEDEFRACSTDYNWPTMTTSKSILAGILASVFGGIALGVITILVVTCRHVRHGSQDGPDPPKKRTPTPSTLESSDERDPLLNDSDSNQSRYDGQRTHPKEAEVEVHPPPLPEVIIVKPARADAKLLTPTPNDFGAGTLGVSHHVAIRGKKSSSSAKKKTTSTSCPQSSSSDDGKKKHHTDAAHDRRRKKRVNRCLSNNDLQFVMDSGSSNGTSDSPHTSMEPSKDTTSSGDERIA